MNFEPLKTAAVVYSFWNEWVSSFLTAYQHIIGYSVPWRGREWQFLDRSSPNLLFIFTQQRAFPFPDKFPAASPFKNRGTALHSSHSRPQRKRWWWRILLPTLWTSLERGTCFTAGMLVAVAAGACDAVTPAGPVAVHATLQWSTYLETRLTAGRLVVWVVAVQVPTSPAVVRTTISIRAPCMHSQLYFNFIHLQRRGHGMVWGLNPPSLQLPPWDSHKTNGILLGATPIRSSASTKLLTAVITHKNLLIWTSYFTNFLGAKIQTSILRKGLGVPPHIALTQ